MCTQRLPCLDFGNRAVLDRNMLRDTGQQVQTVTEQRTDANRPGAVHTGGKLERTSQRKASGKQVVRSQTLIPIVPFHPLPRVPIASQTGSTSPRAPA